MVDCYVVEYSVKQRQFHVEQLFDALRNNRQIILNRYPTDYVIIYLCDTHEEAHLYIRELKNKYNI